MHPDSVVLESDDLSVVCSPVGASLDAIQLLVDGDRVDLAQNGTKCNPQLRRPALVNMYDHCGRVEDGCYPFDPKTGELKTGLPNFELNADWHPMALHGWGNQSLFKKQRGGLKDVTYVLDTNDHPRYRTPSRLRISTTYRLDGTSLYIDVRIENIGEFFVALGSGSHGLFAKYPCSAIAGPVVKFNANAMLSRDVRYPNEAMPDGTIVPIPVEDDFSEGHIPAEKHDHVYCGWDGVATAKWTDLQLSLELRDLSEKKTPYLHLWYDCGRGTWAFEPVTAPGNAFNLTARTGKDFGVRVLGPGASSSFRHCYTWSKI